MAADKQANAAQLRYIPFPYETSMPDMMPWASCIVLTLSTFLTIAVQMAAPIKMNRADRTDIVAEKRNRTVFRSTPLSRGLNDDAKWEWNGTHVNNESAVKIVPSNRK